MARDGMVAQRLTDTFRVASSPSNATVKPVSVASRRPGTQSSITHDLNNGHGAEG